MEVCLVNFNKGEDDEGRIYDYEWDLFSNLGNNI
jgi:hypothetical protein